MLAICAIEWWPEKDTEIPEALKEVSDHSGISGYGAVTGWVL